MAWNRTNSVSNFKWGSAGFTNYEDVYNIIREVDEEYEFYEIEPAFVLDVLLEPSKFPKRGEDNKPDFRYFGCIRAQFQYSQNVGEEISELIKPLSPHFVMYPLVGEIVNIALYGGQYYYSMPLNLRGMVNMNMSDGAVQNEVRFEKTDRNRKLHAKQGDLVISSRFGSAIKLSSDKSFITPTLTLHNNQYKDNHFNEDHKAQYVIQQGKKEEDPQYCHTSNINVDGSTIQMMTDKHDLILKPAAKSVYWDLMPLKFGDLITINSDRIIFNARTSHIHMFAHKNINLAANEWIMFETGETGVIKLGDPNTANPIVKGTELVNFLIEALDLIEAFAGVLSTATGTLEEDNVVTLTTINNAAASLQIELNKMSGEVTEDGETVLVGTVKDILSTRNFTI